MPRKEEVAARIAEVVLRRLTHRKVVDVKDDAAARAVVRQVVLEDLTTEERIDAEARQILLTHAKAIKDSAADYRQLLGKVKEKLARDRGFIL
jgi:hypothetical protein